MPALPGETRLNAAGETEVAHVCEMGIYPAPDSDPRIVVALLDRAISLASQEGLSDPVINFSRSSGGELGFVISGAVWGRKDMK